MKVTVCQLHHDEQLEADWQALVAHVQQMKSDLLLLPEMPFFDWLAASPEVDPAAWRASIAAHEAWWPRLAELEVPTVLTTRPVEENGVFYNEGVRWQAGAIRPVHRKYYLPDEAGYWEASWYSRGDGDFSTVAVGPAAAGFLICTELWFNEKARAYARAGTHLVVTPRCSQISSGERWIVAGRLAAIMAGSFGLSSNHAGPAAGTDEYGGQGWIIDPDGNVLGLTSAEEHFITREVDLSQAEAAKLSYPCYVIE